MSARATFQASGALLRAGFASAVAYRAEMLVWCLATTMPFVMLALWDGAAAGGSLGRYDHGELVAYFLGLFVTRQLSESWAGWHVNMEVRDGTLSMRLLRPVHPFAFYVAENVAELPFRALVCVPAIGIAIYAAPARAFAHDPRLWLATAVAMVGAWVISISFNLAIGCVAFFLESSLKVMELWLVAYFVLSGYFIPLDLFPPALRSVIAFLPFRYMAAFPVEIATGGHGVAESFTLLAQQWIWAGLAALIARFAWSRGVARYGAYGG